MRKLLISLLMIACLVLPASATAITAPDAPAEIEKYIPEESNSFASDVWYIIRKALREITPSLSEVMNICASVLAVQLLIAAVKGFTGVAQKAVIIAGVIVLSGLLLGPSKSLISLGTETIRSISEYNMMLLPTMTAALAAQGATVTSATLYAGTVVMDTVLTGIVVKVITPLLYTYTAVGIASVVVDESVLHQLLGFIKWLITWILKIVVYVFTGYLGITGVISGTIDAATMKATKLAISGVVPIIGNIISDASEAVLVGTGIVKNSVGIYGAIVIIAICIAPFLRVGLQYIMLKATGGISSLYADKKTVMVVQHISTVMGFVAAMTGVVCLLQLISIVCFLKGVSV